MDNFIVIVIELVHYSEGFKTQKMNFIYVHCLKSIDVYIQFKQFLFVPNK